jgi:hypothetical protein
MSYSHLVGARHVHLRDELFRIIPYEKAQYIFDLILSPIV